MSTEFDDETVPVPVGFTPAVAAGLPVPRRWTVVFSVVWFGYWMAGLVPMQLLLPEQLGAIDPSSKVRDFAVVNAVSGLVALVALPVCGALCDRSRSGFGRRRLWLGGGVVVFAAGLVSTGAQTTVPGVTVAWAAGMLGLSAATAGLTAVIADRVPVDQRGLISSAIYGQQALGVVVGVGLATAFDLAPGRFYAILAGVLVLSAVPFLVLHRDVPGEVDSPLQLRELVTTIGSSFRNREFAWAFGGRMLVNLANALGTCYLLYFLTDDLRTPDPAGSLLACTLVYLVAGLAATSIAGVLSDRLGRRRVFVAAAALSQAVSGFLLGGFPSMPVALAASAFMGGGFGAYMAVDQALVTQVLPSAGSRAKDLGIMNIGSVLPPTVAPLLASLVITEDGRGYPVLFAAVGVAAAVGALLVYRIRSVR